ncbi:MAG: hypothetical protein O6850_00570 [Acidobacteria bacterium]|nr:hypothetical protein [Acidobacteriota bacterium]
MTALLATDNRIGGRGASGAHSRFRHRKTAIGGAISAPMAPSGDNNVLRLAEGNTEP